MKLNFKLPSPPWPKLGKNLESLCRKALHNFNLIEEEKSIAIALSGGKDSLTLLFLLHAISGRGFYPFDIHAIHVDGDFSCGAGIDKNFLKNICDELGVNFISKTSNQKIDALECYSCSRERRKLIFAAAKENGIKNIAFGHHRDDSVQTVLLNLFHKGEFAGMLPKVPMLNYDITIIRPLIYISEKQILEFAKHYGFFRMSCQCPKGQNSNRKKVEAFVSEIEEVFPHIRSNLSKSVFSYGSNKALFVKKNKNI
jgi:tRNA(Ile)-lysidine synthetase-like protein